MKGGEGNQEVKKEQWWKMAEGSEKNERGKREKEKEKSAGAPTFSKLVFRGGILISTG